VLQEDPRSISALYVYAFSLRGLEREDDAIKAYRALLEIEPHHAKGLMDLANLLRLKQHNREAQSLFWRVLALDPTHPEAYCGLGTVLRRLGQYGEAEAAFKQACALRPGYADALTGLGSVYLESGNLNAAREVFSQAMAVAPERPIVLYNLAMAGKVRSGDPVLANLEALTQRENSLPSRAREQMHFALAKAYEDTGDRERGFNHQLQGNAIRRRRASYDEAHRMDLFESIRRVFSPELFAAARGLGDPSDTPIFIVGMPRSGSTLIEQILSSHPKIFGAGERYTFPDCVDHVHRRLPPSWTFPNPEAIMAPGLLRELGSAYVQQVRPLAPDAPKIVDKLLGNFRFVGLIHLALPNARIVHAMRDPIDTCLSNFSRLYGDREVEFTYDLAELGRYYRAYETLMAHWRRVLPPGAMLDVRYESVVRDFGSMAPRIVAHCGLEWDDRCVVFHETKRPVNTASVVQVRQPLYQSSVGRWRPNQELLQPLLTALAGS
jgi:Tfp pilus assembly protein PilF